MLKPKRKTSNRTLFGFGSFHDFGSTIIGSKYLEFVLLSATLGGVTSFIENFVYPNSRAVYTLIGLILMDAFTGIYRAVKEKTFSSERLPRILLVLLSYLGLLSLSFNLAKDQTSFSWVPQFLLFGLSTTLFISIIENLSALNLIPKNLVSKIVDNLKRKQDENVPPDQGGSDVLGR
jgi:hypothetical protein